MTRYEVIIAYWDGDTATRTIHAHNPHHASLLARKEDDQCCERRVRELRVVEDEKHGPCEHRGDQMSDWVEIRSGPNAGLEPRRGRLAIELIYPAKDGEPANRIRMYLSPADAARLSDVLNDAIRDDATP